MAVKSKATEQKQGDWADFLVGQQAARDGEPCPAGATEWLERGYNSERGLMQANKEAS